MRNLVFTLLLISCGGGTGSNGGPITPDGVTTSGDSNSFSMSVNFESEQGSAYWTIEPLNSSGKSMGVCEFELKEKSDKTPLYFKNNSVGPICSLITIDPISSIENIKIISDYKVLKYCIYDNGVKKCGEVRK